MAPHSIDTVNGVPQQVSHRRAKSARVAPAIPYSLVKPKQKPKQAAIESPIQEVLHSPILSLGTSRVESTQRSSSPSYNVPKTPISVSSTHEKNGVELNSPTESLSGRVQDSESKPASSVTTSPPSTHAAITSPKVASKTHNPDKSTVSMPGKPGYQNGVSSSSNSHEDMASQTFKAPSGQINDYQHRSNHSINGHGAVPFDSKIGFTPSMIHSMPNSGQRMTSTNTAAVTYDGFMSPPSVSSPTSGWNLNANFIPPSRQSQRPVHDNMSERAVSHTSSTPDARSTMQSSAVSQGHLGPNLPPADVFQWSRHISNFYSDSTFADISLTITRLDKHVFPEFPAHSIILARSSTLSNVMRSSANNPQCTENGQRFVYLEIDEKLTSYSAVLEAVGYLYGLPLPNFSDGVTPDAPFSVVMDRMTSALALAGAGQRLGLPEVMGHSLAFAASLISWATVGKVLGFAYASMAHLSSLDQQDVRRQDLFLFYNHYIIDLMFSLERFVIANLTTEFKFSPSAQELNEARRLPTVVEVRASSHNPLLASIQFGDMPSQGPESIEPDVHLSSILLSVPSHFLERLLYSTELATKMGAQVLISLVKEVITERESRRATVVKAGKRILPSATRLQKDELKWVESLLDIPQAPLGLSVVRLPVDSSSSTLS